jgi:endonuclease-3
MVASVAESKPTRTRRKPGSAKLVSRPLANQMWETLLATYPDADCELFYNSPLQLLVATVLSAQSTDVGVNKVTPVLFARFPDARSLASADRAEVEDIIHSTGFYRNKAASIQGLAEDLLTDYGGEVPPDRDALVKLPGVGRKTANVVLGHAFGIPGITPDTHVQRCSRRMGWTKSSTPDAIEQDLMKLFPKVNWTKLSDVVIWHGRRRCMARKPACGVCPVAQWCPSFGEGPTDPDEAKKLVKL